MWAPGNQWGPWPMDAAMYQNLNHENVDWAALAQQWIRMKEVHETVVINVPANAGLDQYAERDVPPPPPPPPAVLLNSDFSVIGGEAPMDVEKEEEMDEHAESSQGSQDSLPWNWEIQVRNSRCKQSSVPSSEKLIPQAFHCVPPAVMSSQLPTLPIRNPPPGRAVGSSDEDSRSAPTSFAAMPALDAAKRKQLPAWIREGLEKMEREKQKREEREQFLQHRELRRKQEMLALPVDDVKALTRSRFDDDDDSSDSDNDEQSQKDETVSTIPTTPGNPISAEHLVVVIRRLMTEVLLEVTTEEIRSAANDAYAQRSRAKSRAAPQPSLDPSSKRVKPLTQRLGLDQYGSDDDDEEAGDSDGQQQALDSDKNLQDRRNSDGSDETSREVDGDKNYGSRHEKNGMVQECGEQIERLDNLSNSEKKEETKVETDTNDSGGNRSRHGTDRAATPGSVSQSDNSRSSLLVSDKRHHTKSSHSKKRSRSRSRERWRSRSRERNRRSHSRRRSRSRSRDRRRSRSRDRYYRRRSRHSRSPTSKRRSRSRVRSRSRSRSRGRSSRTHRLHPSHSTK